MDFKKINSKSKIGFVIGLIFCMTILLTIFDLGLNFVNNSEKYDKESNTLSQSQLKKNLPFENEYLGYKKKNPVLPDQGLQVQKPDKRNPEYEIGFYLPNWTCFNSMEEYCKVFPYEQQCKSYDI